MIKIRKTLSKIQLQIEGLFFLVAGIGFLIFTFESDNPIKYILTGTINLCLSIFIFWISKSYWLNCKKENSPNYFQRKKDVFSWIVYLVISLFSAFAGYNLMQKASGILFVIFFFAFSFINLLSSFLRFYIWKHTKYKSGNNSQITA